MTSKGKDRFDIVVALDIGTAYSGYAFSTVEDFNADPLDIHYIQSWNAGKKRLVSRKTPTCLLLNRNEKLVAFGYEAEAAYAKKIDEEGHKNSFYFHRFKMKLCRREVSKTCIPDTHLSTKCLTNHCVFSNTFVFAIFISLRKLNFFDCLLLVT